MGVAVSDPLCMTAQGVKTVKNRGLENLINDISEIINEYKPETIVIGKPKNMDGTEGFRVEETLKFAEDLKTIYSGKIEYIDERLTTVSATRVLNETNTRGKDRKAVLDTVSACFILETYLNLKK